MLDTLRFRFYRWVFRRYFKDLLYHDVSPFWGLILDTARLSRMAVRVHDFVTKAILHGEDKVSAFRNHFSSIDLVTAIVWLGGMEATIKAVRPDGLIGEEAQIDEYYDEIVDGFATQGDVDENGNLIYGKTRQVPVKVPVQKVRKREVTIAEYASMAKSIIGFVLAPHAADAIVRAEEA